MTNSTDVSDVKMTGFGHRLYLIRERHVRVEMKPRLRAEELHIFVYSFYYTPPDTLLELTHT